MSAVPLLLRFIPVVTHTVGAFNSYRNTRTHTRTTFFYISIRIYLKIKLNKYVNTWIIIQNSHIPAKHNNAHETKITIN